MQQLIARRPLRYGGRLFSAGAVFVATRTDARVLVALQSASLAPPQSPSPADDETPRPRRTYKRRDLTAEMPCALPD